MYAVTRALSAIELNMGQPATEGSSSQAATKKTLRWLYAAHVLQCLSTTMREQAAPALVFRLFTTNNVVDMVASTPRDSDPQELFLVPKKYSQI